MKIKKVSTVNKILAFARNHGGWFTASHVAYLAKGKSKSNVYVALAALKKAGKLAHNPDTKQYLLNQNSKTVTVTAPEKPKLDPARENDAKTIQYLIEEQNRLHSELAATDEKYDDALAVIRYLEDKLIKTIQYTARKGDAE